MYKMCTYSQTVSPNQKFWGKSRNTQIISNKIPFNYDKKQWWRETCNEFRIYRLVIFWRKKRGKMPFFVFIDPYRTRPGTGETCSLHVTPPVEITPKIPAKFALLNSSFAFGDLRLGGWLRTPRPQAPARAQSPTRNTRIKRRKFRGGFWGYFGIQYQNQATQNSLARDFGSSS